MNDPVWGLGIVALITAVLAPYLLNHQAAKTRTAEKLEDWKRQDEVAARAAEVARQLLAKQEETASKTAEAAVLLLENNKVVARTAKTTNEKLDVIHTLVNSNMTSALQAELDAVQAQCVLMRELITFKTAQGIDPSEDTITVLEGLEAKVQQLSVNLKERLEQTKVADAQIFIAAKSVLDDEEDTPKT